MRIPANGRKASDEDIALAGPIHLSTFWGFVRMALHLGLHWNMIPGIVRKAIGLVHFCLIGMLQKSFRKQNDLRGQKQKIERALER